MEYVVTVICEGQLCDRYEVRLWKHVDGQAEMSKVHTESSTHRKPEVAVKRAGVLSKRYAAKIILEGF